MALPIDVYRLIPAFLASAEAQSFSAAARQLGISAAAVSKNVRALEMRLNIRLFARNTHFVMLTEEGGRFSPSDNAIMAGIKSGLGRATAE